MIKKREKFGMVLGTANTPRSYIVTTADGEYRSSSNRIKKNWTDTLRLMHADTDLPGRGGCDIVELLVIVTMHTHSFMTHLLI